MQAILSDIHGNLEALQAVLHDISRHRVEAIYCLGDVVGYGPNPRECLEAARAWDLVLLGNHDHAALAGADDFNPVAERALLWSRGQIDQPIPSPDDATSRWAFLSLRSAWHRQDDLLFVHGSPRDPLWEYVFPQDVHHTPKMQLLFEFIEGACFQGHTHVPGIFTEALEFLAPEEIGHEYRLGREKAMINVGSVGQPRDSDPRACYVLLDEDAVRFRRVEYDVETTVAKIHAIAGLPGWLGDRLRRGV
jgi:diadenosine tetraphosphatase ApaH/serine/threonine PP2A family protein phosphatase